MKKAPLLKGYPYFVWLELYELYIHNRKSIKYYQKNKRKPFQRKKDSISTK